MLVGWDVTGIKVTGNVQEATASYNSLLDTCPKCGSVDRLYRHGVKAVDYRDAPAFGKQFVIRCQVQRDMHGMMGAVPVVSHRAWPWPWVMMMLTPRSIESFGYSLRE
jgi:hypothetical protein